MTDPFLALQRLPKPCGIFSYRSTTNFKRDKNVRIGRFTKIRCSGNITLAENVRIGDHTRIDVFDLEMGRDSRIQHNVQVTTYKPDENKSLLKMMPHSEIFQGCIVDCSRSVFIGENVGVGGHSRLWTHGGWEQGGHKTAYGSITIRDNAWLAWDVIILPNVIIYEGAVVAAGSVVTKDVQPYTVVGGNPAKFIKMRPDVPPEILKYQQPDIDMK